MSRQLRIYNPRECPPATLDVMTVGRESLVTELVADLVRQARDRVRQPWLLHAPRGFGKTHLLAVLYHRLHRDPDLRRQLLPLWLPESDALVAFDVRSFLDQILGQLADERRDDPDAAARVRAAMGADFSPAGISMREECLVREAAAAGVTFIVFVENLDELAAVLDRSPSNREAKRLRVLLTQPRFPIFVCTTTRARFESIESALRPLHQLFRFRHLAPLDEDESRELYRRLRSADQPSGQTADLEPWDQARIRLFHRLTGGSPRSIVIAFAAITAANGIGALVAELESLLDQHTPTFEQRFADLAPRERAIVAAMATAPITLTLQEIAAHSGLPLRSLSTQIDRLSEVGWVTEAFDAGGKGTLWEIRDGLFRVWLQYRRGNRVLAPLVRFLALWFEPDEIARSLEMSATMSSASQPIEDRESTVRHLREAFALARTPEIAAERAAIRREFGRVARDRSFDHQQAQLGDSFGGFEPAPRLRNAVEHELAAVRELNRSGQHEAALVKIDEAISRLLVDTGSPEERALAEALVVRGLTLRNLGRSGEEIASYEEVVRRFGERSEPTLAEHVAKALVNKAIRQGALGRVEDEIATYDEVVRRFGDRLEATLAAQVARALVNKAMTYGTTGRAADAIPAFDEVTQRFGARPELVVTVQVARALINKGISHSEASRAAEAIATYDDVVRRFSERPEAALVEQVAQAFVNRAVQQLALGRAEEAVATSEEAMRRFGERPEEAVAVWVAMALLIQGAAQGQVGRADDEISTYDEVLRRFEGCLEGSHAALLAVALLNKGVTQAQIGQSSYAIATYDEVVRRFGGRSDVLFAEQVAQALVNRGYMEEAAGRAPDAIETYDEVVRRFGDRPEPALAERVARALVNKGVRQGVLGQAGALATYDEVVRRFGERPEPTLAEQVADALVKKGDRQGVLGQTEDAIATYDEVVRRFGDHLEPALAEQIARTLVNKGNLQDVLGRAADQIASYDEVMRRFGERTELELGYQVARSLVLKGALQVTRGEFEEAVRLFDEVTVRFAEPPAAEFRPLVAGALVGKLVSCVATGDDVGVAESIRMYSVHVAPLPTNNRPALDEALALALTRFGSQRLRLWIEPMRSSGDADLAATVQIFDYVLDVADAAETGTSGIARQAGLKQRMARALARVPIEYRATVRERADSVIRGRRQTKSGRHRRAGS